jgi:tRNA threonylcarbamoyladenosine biosynthesis protein TsaE
MERCQLVLETAGAAETQGLGVALAQLLRSGDVIALAGDLGTGKTAFTQGLARGLGVTAPVTSPTFTLINQYVIPGGSARLQHVDCYRLSNASAEMLDAGLTDLFAGENIVVIEWADRIPGLLPEECLKILFTYLADDRRCLCLNACGARYVALVGLLAAETAEHRFAVG